MTEQNTDAATPEATLRVSAEPAATPPTTLILVRHGETMGNRDRRFQTYDTPLSDLGRQQAAWLAERLAAGPPVQAIYSSDLARTMETATIVGERLGLVPQSEPALRELDTGDWKGRMHDEFAKQHTGGFEGWISGGGIDRHPGPEGESAADVEERAVAAVARIIAAHPGERLVLVSHGLTLAILLAHIHGWDRAETLNSRRASHENTALSIVEWGTDGERRCTLLASADHLDDSLRATRAPGAV